MTMLMMTLEAKWVETQGVYAVVGRDWISDDGDAWRDANGQPAAGDFDAVTIRFVGGPRDGQTVS